MDVRTQVADFNWEIDLFLRSLSRFRANVNKVDSDTIQLLSDTLESIGNFVSEHDVIVENDEKSKMFVIDEHKFEVSRFITCRICCLQIPLTRAEYLNHVTSDYHNAKLIRQLKADDEKSLPSPKEIKTSAARDVNGNAHVTNGTKVPNVSENINKNAAMKASVANGTSWRDREPVPAQAPLARTPTPTNGAMFPVPRPQPPMRNYGDHGYDYHQPPLIHPYEHNIMCQKVGPPLFSMPYYRQSAPMINPFPMQMKPFNQPPKPIVKPSPLQTNQPTEKDGLFAYLSSSTYVPSTQPIQKALPEPAKPQPKPVAKAPSPLPVNQTVPSVVPPTSKSTASQPNQKASLESAKPQPKPVAAASSSSTSKQPVPPTTAAKISPIVPPNVFDEDIFEFIESQGSVKPSEPLQSVAKPNEIPKKIVNASTSAEIKRSTPYDLNSMYAKFSHLKQSTTSASVPLATKATAAKPAQPIASNRKTSGTDDLQMHKFLTKAAQKPNQPQPNKPVTAATKPQKNIQNAHKSNTTDDAHVPFSTGLANKLRHMFDEINKLKSKAELEEIKATRELQRSSSIVSLPAAGAANESRKQTNESHTFRRSQQAPAHSQSNLRGRSLSNSNVIDTSKGAIPKHRNSPNANKNHKGYSPTKQRDALSQFFSRDLIPQLSQLMEKAISMSELPLNKAITDEIERLLKPKYPSAKCYLIGSRMYGIAKESSTMDIYLNLHDSFNQDKEGRVYVAGIADAEELFHQSSVWSNVECTEQTRYGILSVAHNATKIKCRMVFGTGVPVRNTKVIQCLFDLQPVCRQLVICIQLAMQDTQNPSLQRFKNGYVVSMLVLFYFQKQEKLPSVKSMQEHCTAKIKCGENNCEFQKPKDVPICSDRFLNILVSFFKFYSEFDFAANIISVYHGHEIDQSIRDTPDNQLQPSLLRFKRFLHAEAHNQWSTRGMCIQDVFMHKRNVTKLVSATEIAEFRIFCNVALDALQAVGSSVRY